MPYLWTIVLYKMTNQLDISVVWDKMDEAMRTFSVLLISKTIMASGILVDLENNHLFEYLQEYREKICYEELVAPETDFCGHKLYYSM